MDKQTANYYIINRFKEAVKAYNSVKTEKTREQHNKVIEGYLEKYSGLEVFDKRNRPMTNKTTDYIEIKQGSLVFKKQGANLVITVNETMVYTEENLKNFRASLESGLAVIAAASKFETPITTGNVSILLVSSPI